MMFQLRGGESPELDTGELVVVEDAQEALELFITGKYWKLSWHMDAQDRRMRLVKSGNTIRIAPIDIIMENALNRT